GSLLIDGSTAFFTGIFSESLRPGTCNAGDAGTLTASVARLLNIVGGGRISSSTISNGKGGDLSIPAGSLSIDGSATPGQFTGIGAESNSEATGDAGDPSITTDRALTIVGVDHTSSPTLSTRSLHDALPISGSLLIDGSTAFFTGIFS